MTHATNSAQQNQGRATKKKEINIDESRLELSDFFSNSTFSPDL